MTDKATARLLIAGVPRSGKSTLATRLGEEHACNVLHTDDLIESLDWSAVSAHVATVWFDKAGPWIIEGVAVGRAIRKWLAANPHGLPADGFMYLSAARVSLTDGQGRMAKGCATVWDEIEPELKKRGAIIRAR